MFLFASTSLIVVNLLFAAIALAIGFAAGAWVCAGSDQKSVGAQDGTAEGQVPTEDALLERERAILATDRLRDLATGVATDVGAHSDNIHQIEEQFASLQEKGISEDDISQVFQKIASANETLQERLAKAEEQIQAQAEAIRTHESDARTDSLTQLTNRRGFDDELTRRIAEWDRHGTPCTLLILDVDHFKKFNDTHGHQAGDEVLRKVGKVLTESARDMDLPCRYGGEEFAVVLPATVGKDGGIVAERVRKAIEAMDVVYEGKSLHVTASVGIAQAGHGETANELIKRSDEALYESKKAGRNCSYLHTGDVSVPITTPAPSASAASEKPPAAAESSYASLPNRTRFIEELRQSLRDAKEKGQPVTIMTSQLSGYEQVRQEFGSAIAQMMLDSVTQFLDNSLGDNSVLGRLDDGQFAVLMPGSDAKQASRKGDQIENALSKCSVPLGESCLQLSMVQSVTELEEHDNPVSFMQNAERNLQLKASDPDEALI